MQTQPKPKIIIFDIGGVLIEYNEVFETASKELNIPIETFVKSFVKYDTEITTGKITPQELYLNCIADNNLSADKSYDFLKSWLKDFKVMQPTFDMVIELQSAYPIALLSNIYTGLVPAMLGQKLLPNIDYKHMFLSCDIGLQKPDDAIYEYVLQQTKLKPEEIFYIDDREDFIKPAVKAGWQTYQFPRENPESGVQELQAKLL